MWDVLRRLLISMENYVGEKSRKTSQNYVGEKSFEPVSFRCRVGPQQKSIAKFIATNLY